MLFWCTVAAGSIVQRFSIHQVIGNCHLLFFVLLTIFRFLVCSSFYFFFFFPKEQYAAFLEWDVEMLAAAREYNTWKPLQEKLVYFLKHINWMSL